MLYQERALGRPGFWSRIAARLTMTRRAGPVADLDLLSLNPHLQRDLGLTDGQSGLRHR